MNIQKRNEYADKMNLNGIDTLSGYVLKKELNEQKIKTYGGTKFYEYSEKKRICRQNEPKRH